MTSIKKGGKYHNLDFVEMKLNPKKVKGILKNYLAKKDSIPSFKVPRVKIGKELFQEEDSFVWLGHSTILGNLDKLSFIVDPMFSKRASPLKNFGPKRFEGSLSLIEELPKIDIILITHNHYDHMDKETLLSLQNSVEKIFVPLDNAKILINWGIKKEKIREFDWFEQIVYKDVLFTFCPTQHFSGRTLSDRNNYLWGSWAVKGSAHSIYISGDSGYNRHFKQIGEKLETFDVACLECGAYNENWSEVHMLPEESVQASKDLNAKVMLPMHWAGFDLSSHSWDEPITRAIKEAKELNVELTTPIIGQVLRFSNSIENKKWWKKY